MGLTSENKLRPLFVSADKTTLKNADTESIIKTQKHQINNNYIKPNR